jgi:hypothetical protein
MCTVVRVKREDTDQCAVGDWVALVDAPARWSTECSPYSWRSPSGEIWFFAYTEVPTIDPDEGVVGTDFVWMRYDPNGTVPPRPKGVAGFRTTDEEAEPADWWKTQPG